MHRRTAVSRVLLAWELGANMGHLDRMLLTARELRRRGHEVTFALKDLSRAHGRVVSEGFSVVQSPIWLPRMAKSPGLVNFSAVLASAGWLDPAGLAGLLSGWRTLFDLCSPDLLVCDHAPTAMLAARACRFPVAAVGNGFEVPAFGDVFPALHYWDAADTAVCAASDATVLRAVNAALAALGQPGLPRLTALFADILCIVASLPELAHYPVYPDSVVRVGPSFVDDAGAQPQWPKDEGKDDREGIPVFAYLSPEHADFAPLMAALRQPGLRSVVHAKGLSAATARELGAPNIRFEAAPVRMDLATAQARIVLSHASVGTVSAAALAGCVQLVLPNHMEQYMVGRRVVEAGIGLMVEPGSRGTDYPALLRRLIDDTAFSEAALALAGRHAGVRPDHTGVQVVDALAQRLALGTS
ncbi:glycosyltransferase [Methyloversatilis sp. RAC08]|uniref:glycosyltransferase n=1 Tax=Methyloversatilis sp. RAC08 TaxID=1842540 RepID=UPI001680C71C|nr:nucleotide disphospho-sugar-binding domain-containing protein [Methyloversatilis sp. RAC08]